MTACGQSIVEVSPGETHLQLKMMLQTNSLRSQMYVNNNRLDHEMSVCIGFWIYLDTALESTGYETAARWLQET